ncbi:GNAT family N-acetyltransferase [Gracilibacillus salinarum]|uniref:GNAT family N-acetyltransferase n=1 Tax=Gracilibacillus salinarum TaxID=2932255 RepID=A0ABY4GPC7_9BACI|nr:N-acetyltransferase [Gracilibacillus salinarum]UOQ86246.1 GNAT family N-acetyltransferase [Gracilibacillus salinarum]
MSIEIVRASDLGEVYRKRISEIFVDGFGHELTFFTQDKQRLAQALEHMFNLNVFYCALVEGEMAGITACTDSFEQSVTLDKRKIMKHLGLFKGMIAYKFLKPEFEKQPVLTGSKLASVEFVATASAYRKKGIATALLQYVQKLSPYQQYILEVANVNLRAIQLYQQLGFKEFKRIKPKHSKKSGIDYLIYMKYDSK